MRKKVWMYFLVGLLAFCPAMALAGESQILRMGNADVSLFDEGWLFKRYGLQADGTTLNEPTGLEKKDLADGEWQAVDLPHDYAIEGPFRLDLAGETGKLPYQGIGWYRKHFSYTKKAGERLYMDFDGAMANAKVWLNGRYVGTWPYGYNSFRMDLTPYFGEGGECIGRSFGHGELGIALVSRCGNLSSCVVGALPARSRGSLGNIYYYS